MREKTSFIVVIVILVLFFAVGMYLGLQSVPQDDEYAACPVFFEQVIESAKGDVYNFEGETEFKEPESFYLVSYSVNGDAISNPTFDEVPVDLKDEQADAALQQSAWELFTTLIPAENRQMVVQFDVFTDGNSNTLAAVSQTYDDPSLWGLEVDIADLEDREMLLFTLIHEYAHLLTLNQSQVIPDSELAIDPFDLDLQIEKAAACDSYFTGLGCSQPRSYIQAFYDRFWAGIYSEWSQADLLQYEGDEIAYYNALHDFYKKYQDQFVDDYSVTHSTEDIAESFTYFVFSPKPQGSSIRDQKLLFFYEYPELIRLREHILNAACSITDQPSKP